MTKLTKTLVASAIATAVLTGSAFAQGGGQPLLQQRDTYPNVVAQYDGGEIFAQHPNAYSKGPSTPTVAQYNNDRIFAGHGNTLHIARSRLLAPNVVTTDFAEK